MSLLKQSINQRFVSREEEENQMVLEILVREGELFRDTELFGEMDPFVAFEVNDRKCKTKTI